MVRIKEYFPPGSTVRVCEVLDIKDGVARLKHKPTEPPKFIYSLTGHNGHSIIDKQYSLADEPSETEFAYNPKTKTIIPPVDFEGRIFVFYWRIAGEELYV